MALVSFYQSSYAIELEQSSYVISLSYEPLCLFIHTMYMIRLGSKMRWRFIVPSGMPNFYACRSIGSKSWGDLGNFYVRGHGAWVYGDLQL
jgi:hypothetical protein